MENKKENIEQESMEAFQSRMEEMIIARYESMQKSFDSRMSKIEAYVNELDNTKYTNPLYGHIFDRLNQLEHAVYPSKSLWHWLKRKLWRA